MADGAITLKQLLEAPSESMSVEMKAWLDLKDNKGHQATLAKALIALANHGGGSVIIGFDDSNGEPAQNRPRNLASYKGDAVNNILKKFADPCFHCTVQMVTRDTDGLNYPVISVPGGHKVPIRSKRGSDGDEIQADRYYIRRSGPASEVPQSGYEWDELIRRCIRNNTDEIASLLRDVLEGRVPSPRAGFKVEVVKGLADQLARCETDSFERWSEKISMVPDDSQVRMPHGHYSVAAVIEGVDCNIHQLGEIIQRAEQNLTGWPPWMLPTSNEWPKIEIHENGIECHIARPPFDADAASSDFWRASTTGQLFIVRGYPEDSPAWVAQDPGTSFDWLYPIEKIGECLLFIQRFAFLAHEARTEDSMVSVRCRWSGLEGRTLDALYDHSRMLARVYRAQTDEYVSEITVPVARISGALPEIVRDLVKPLYALFDFFEPPGDIYSVVLARMQGHEG